MFFTKDFYRYVVVIAIAIVALPVFANAFIGDDEIIVMPKDPRCKVAESPLDVCTRPNVGEPFKCKTKENLPPRIPEEERGTIQHPKCTEFFDVNVSKTEALLKPSQIQAIVDLLKSFGASDEVVTKVSNVLEGKAPLPDKAGGIVKKRFCPNIYGELYPGKRGPSVSELQRFLKEKGYYDYPEITGYFGPVTKRAVQKMQKAMKIVSTGSPETTGYGMVGPKTRLAIRNMCGEIGILPHPIPAPEPVFCTKNYAPVCGLINPCPKGAYCLVPEIIKTFSNKCMLEKAHAKLLYSGECKKNIKTEVPNIHSFTGPVLLNVGEKGTWRISASDISNQPLTYSIDWGDRKLYSIMSRDVQFKMLDLKQKNSFEHAYSRPGTYVITITVKNTAGKTAKVSSTVRVIQGTSVCVDGNKTYKEGATLTCLQEQGCIADAEYVCTNGAWKIRGSYPTEPINNGAKINSLTVKKTNAKISKTLNISWKHHNISDDEWLALKLTDTDNHVYKAMAVDPRSNSASMTYNKWCNSDFSDVIDGACASLRKAIQDGKKFIVKAQLYTPKNACFGYCPSNSPKPVFGDAVRSKVFDLLAWWH